MLESGMKILMFLTSVLLCSSTFCGRKGRILHGRRGGTRIVDSKEVAGPAPEISTRDEDKRLDVSYKKITKDITLLQERMKGLNFNAQCIIRINSTFALSALVDGQLSPEEEAKHLLAMLTSGAQEEASKKWCDTASQMLGSYGSEFAKRLSDMLYSVAGECLKQLPQKFIDAIGQDVKQAAAAHPRLRTEVFNALYSGPSSSSQA